MEGRGLRATEMEGLVGSRLGGGCEGRRCVLCPPGGVCGGIKLLIGVTFSSRPSSEPPGKGLWGSGDWQADPSCALPLSKVERYRAQGGRWWALRTWGGLLEKARHVHGKGANSPEAVATLFLAFLLHLHMVMCVCPWYPCAPCVGVPMCVPSGGGRHSPGCRADSD